MIEYKTGDLLAEEADALVNTVNCVGHMGAGIALQFKKAWPDNFRAYAAACRNGEVQPGRMFVYETRQTVPPSYIINFPTKRHWRGKSRLGDIEAGLEALVTEIRRLGLGSIAVPPLGAGLGGLPWKEVQSRIERALGALPDLHVVVFEPHGTPEHARGRRAKRKPQMTSGRAALLGLMDRYLAGLLDPFVSLLEVHKLMYFMQEAGEPLRLKMEKAVYGPYAENLRHVLNSVEGHYVTGYGVGGDAPDKPLELMPNAVEEARALLEKQPQTRQRLERVADLVEGFESPFGLELLSTVHWLATREGVSSDEEAIAGVYQWGPRKQRFRPRQITLARRVLSEQGWLEAASCPLSVQREDSRVPPDS